MIRILHIVHAVTKGGGLTNIVMNYYRYIDKTKIQFDFLYFRDSENTFKEEIESLGGRCFKMSQPSLSVAFFKERKAFFKEHKGEFAAVHCHALFAAAVFVKTAKKYGASHSYSHSHNIGYGKGNPIKRLRNMAFISQAKRLSDYHLACSKDAAAFMFGKKELESGKVKIINNAIDCDKYWFDSDRRNALRKELDINDRFVIGHIGGFVPQKNHTFLIDVFYEFQKSHPDSMLLLIGGEGLASGSTKTDLQNKAANLHLTDKIRFLGLRDDVNELVSAMDIFVFPSLFEGLGIVLVEAQASGLPCVVSSAIPEETRVLESYEVVDSFNDPRQWVDVINKNMNYPISDRYVDHDLFYRFDIKKQYTVLQNLYLNMKLAGDSK